MYERMSLKQEYMYTFRMLVVLLLHMHDFVKLRSILETFKTDNSFDNGIFIKMWNGEKLFDQAKEKGIIMRCGDGNFACNIPKTEIFRTCVVPALRNVYSQHSDMRKVLTEFVENLNAANDGEVNVDMN